jgi:hypothetical protein
LNASAAKEHSRSGQENCVSEWTHGGTMPGNSDCVNFVAASRSALALQVKGEFGNPQSWRAF